MPKQRKRSGPAIAFDADARREHLRGFSDRKKARRAYGLAMQAVKDRASRVAERQDRREVMLERIEQAEKAKEEWLEAALLAAAGGGAKDDEAAVAVAAMARAVGATKKSERNKNKNDEEEDDTTVPMKDGGATAADEKAATIVQTYADQQTEQQWGGTVVVTIGSAIPDSDDDEEEDASKLAARAKQKPRSRKDVAQEFAGTVDRFLQESKGRGKISKAHKHKGKHGSADMRGVGGAGGLKVAQSFLKRSKGMNNKKDSKRKDSKKKARR
jgi:hypothetical protein